MSSDNSSSNSTDSYSYSSSKRYWRKSDNPVLPWWPWGILFLLALLLLFLYGIFRIAPAMEKQTQNAVSEKLSSQQHLKLDNVSADGQGVNIVATTSDEMITEDYLHALAKTTACETWAGDKTCPTDVVVSLKFSDSEKEAVPVEVVITPEPTPTITSRYHDYVFEKSDKQIVVEGEVPSATVRTDILANVGRNYDSITDRLTISNEMASDAHKTITDLGLSILDRLNAGTVKWQQGVLSVKGFIFPEDETDVRDLISTDIEGLTLGEIDLQLLKAPQACNEEFANALENNSINFQTASAVIDSSSQTLINQLATIATTCPGLLLVEGHTDSVGSESSNQLLSENRALSVRDALVTAGLSPDRISSQGFGEAQPIATNDTAAGRAKNRRIVIQVTAIEEETQSGEDL